MFPVGTGLGRRSLLPQPSRVRQTTPARIWCRAHRASPRPRSAAASRMRTLPIATRGAPAIETALSPALSAKPRQASAFQRLLRPFHLQRPPRFPGSVRRAIEGRRLRSSHALLPDPTEAISPTSRTPPATSRGLGRWPAPRPRQLPAHHRTTAPARLPLPTLAQPSPTLRAS